MLRPLSSLVVSLTLASALAAQQHTLVSVTPAGTPGNNQAWDARVSGDGRYVIFDSYASDLVTGDTNGTADVFRRDTLTGTTVRVSLSPAGAELSVDAFLDAMTPDGRFVVFEWPFSTGNVWVWDAQTGAVSLGSAKPDGTPVKGTHGLISDDGRYVYFNTQADMAAADVTVGRDVYVRDLQTGAVDVVTIGWAGTTGEGDSTITSNHALSQDGRYVVFGSAAWNLVPGGTPPDEKHVYRRDRQTGAIVLLDQTPGGQLANGYSYGATISGDGRFAAFMTHGTNLVPDSNGSLLEDVIVRDMQTGALEMANVSALGSQQDGWAFGPCLSDDGRYVSFHSMSTGYNPLDAIPNSNSDYDVFLRDRVCGLTQLVSVHAPNSLPATFQSLGGDLAADLRHVAFESDAKLAPADTNLQRDVYVTDWVDNLPWKDVGGALAGTLGVPALAGEGNWALASTSYIGLGRVVPGSTAMLVVGVAALNAPLKGGVLVPAPLLVLPIPVGPTGRVVLQAELPAGVPHGSTFYLQAWMQDAAGPKGFSASNGLSVTIG